MAGYPNDSQIDDPDAASDCAKSYQLLDSLLVEDGPAIYNPHKNIDPNKIRNLGLARISQAKPFVKISR
jgi:hypothetical protein